MQTFLLVQLIGHYHTCNTEFIHFKSVPTLFSFYLQILGIGQEDPSATETKPEPEPEKPPEEPKPVSL